MSGEIVAPAWMGNEALPSDVAVPAAAWLKSPAAQSVGAS